MDSPAPADSSQLLSLAEELKRRALGLGLGLVGIADASPSRHAQFFSSWIEAGYHGEMGYLEDRDSMGRRADLRRTMSTVGSVVVVGQEYGQGDPPEVLEDPSKGVIARYARGGDYHRILGDKLRELAQWLDDQGGSVTEGPTRVYVDTGPVLERELAQRAGLGWFGKNTMLLSPRRGSYFFLGVLLTEMPLPPDPPFESDHCGSCVRCVQACPTGALLGRDEAGAPVIDASRCISYLTIEHRGSIPEPLRPGLGNRVFGCDICQEVCPWNERFAQPAMETAYRPSEDLAGLSLIDLTDRLLGISEKQYLRDFSDSPLARPRRKGMLRNLCVALGNWGSPEAIPTLERALRDSQSLVREHAAWALARIRTHPSNNLQQ